MSLFAWWSALLATLCRLRALVRGPDHDGWFDPEHRWWE